MAFVLVLALPSEARKLAIFEEKSSFNLEDDANVKQAVSVKLLNFGMLPKYKSIPPSGPSRRTSDSTPPPKDRLNFGMLSKYTPLPPSGPSRRTSDSTPPPKDRLNFGMLPKYTPLPPSGPSTRTSDSTPPPPVIRD
ncbi:leucine-rich repeat extensin-like protein 1 [Juglans microcarpa x Juglans regia]|uniref:leucine-rich repeat extensin-like protein 1 n=1 Tax=Juglans microcarpa x Juglans regia TaxID=2249226 RepID=UPI001B7F1FF6|nr:leucine-rich repeat extensin-like protein 1 [Juglans microcarpa x Juglans regia]